MQIYGAILFLTSSKIISNDEASINFKAKCANDFLYKNHYNEYIKIF